MTRISKITLLMTALTVFLILLGAFIVVRKNFNEVPPTPRATVTIPEGSTVREVNRILIDAGILDGEEVPTELEGYLFPDTYEFFISSRADVVLEKFQENFEEQLEIVLSEKISESRLREVVTMASIIEREVPDSEERKLVSGVLWKRIENGVPLQVDATLCYLKEGSCLPITRGDKTVDSPYNTYQYRGLPPGPIGNPGIDAISASLNPEASPYWYYLSDPDTGNTIFAKALDEHNSNIVKYLSN